MPTLRETILSPHQGSDMSLRSIDLPVSWVATQHQEQWLGRDPAYLLAARTNCKVAARTNSKSRRERTAKSRRERTQSHGANKLKVTARTNCEVAARTNYLLAARTNCKVAARTNSQWIQSPISPSLLNEIDRSSRRLGRDPVASWDNGRVVTRPTYSKSRRERTQREVSFDLVERETFLSPPKPGRW